MVVMSNPATKSESVKKPLAELIVAMIEKSIPKVRSSDYEEATIKMLSEALIEATDITDWQRALVLNRFQVFASHLISADEQRLKRYLLEAIEKLR
jgi:hypothetical protein